jgi:hypothetical protein
VDEGYLALAARLTAGGVLSDPWLDGQPRFSSRPRVLSRAEDRALVTAAEELALAWDEGVRLCHADPALRARFFDLPPALERMWRASAPAWHGIARADVFLTADGPKVCELNCDTPSGEAEAVLLAAAAHAESPSLRDPSAHLPSRFAALLEAVAPRAGALTVGIVYPTELVEDLSMILAYRRWIEQRGHRVVLGSPFNLRERAGGVALFGARCDVIVRHYKTDWWGEREPPFRDEPPFADARPLDGPLDLLLSASTRGACVVVNPFGAVLAQNKRMMALLWEAIDRLSPVAQSAVRRFLPYTARLEALSAPPAREEWVLKSDYGCEGAEVIVGAEVSDEVWQRALAQARPGRFIAQRRFVPVADDGRAVNYGVYLVGGQAAGYLTRIDRGATSTHAVTVPTLVEAT